MLSNWWIKRQLKSRSARGYLLDQVKNNPRNRSARDSQIDQLKNNYDQLKTIKKQ